MHFNLGKIDIDVFENKRCGDIAESFACQSDRSTAAGTRIGLQRRIRFVKKLRILAHDNNDLLEQLCV